VRGAAAPLIRAEAAPPRALLYLHGFRSSPASTKARQTIAAVAARHPGTTCWCPQLPPSPAAALARVEAGLAAWPAGRFAIVGSSLGGFYAMVLAARHGCPAVLLNPAVDPARDLAAHVGEHSTWHAPGQRFVFEPHFVDELEAMTPDRRAPLPHAERMLALIATGDEVLDHREMHARCEGATRLVIQGSDHAISDYAEHLPRVLGFLHLDGHPAPERAL
jgi:predicted esterase YcpF (UPF0227 family)